MGSDLCSRLSPQRTFLKKKDGPSGNEGLNLFIEGGPINGEMHRATSKVPELPDISVTGRTELLDGSKRVEKIASSLLSQFVFVRFKIYGQISFFVFLLFCDLSIFVFFQKK
jgi:hypothetical protein